MRNELIYSILNKTAWQMDTPQISGTFHVTALIITVVFAAAAAHLLSRKVRMMDHAETTAISDSGTLPADLEMTDNLSSNDSAVSCYFTKPLSGSQEEALKRILAVTGWILALLELYKQLFLYFIVNGGTYDWWYFPFQLCSVPMYLCILLPFVSKRLCSTFLTFMSGYTFISAVAALIYPEDFLRPYISLTLHGFVWHGLLLFISLLIWFSGAAQGSDALFRTLLSAAILFTVLCVVAVLINISVEPVMRSASAAHTGITHSYASMFYLNPYHTSPQPIVGTVQRVLGIPSGLVIYSLAIITVSSLFLIAVKHFQAK